MILTDLLILVLIGYAGYVGARRGAILVTLELMSFMLASVAAVSCYRAAGLWLRDTTGTTTSLADVTAFVALWVLVELSVALTVRFLVLPRLSRIMHPRRLTQAGGAMLSSVKALILVTVALVLFAELPLSTAAKRPVVNAVLAKALLSSNGPLQQWAADGLGRDLSDSFNFFTVPPQPEDTQRIELGFTTTQVKVDEASEDLMLTLINRERTSRGLHPLILNPRACTVARAYSRRMLAEGYFSHRDNEGHSPFDRLRAAGVKFGAAGENLALAPTLQLAHQGLMHSPGHRANILSTNYRTVGIGVIDAGPYGLMIAQEFTD